MKRAFFVLGAQGSGTRMLTAAFIAAGCRGSAAHQQPLDNLDFSGEGDLVFRRSLPHGGEWPDLLTLADRMEEDGYECVPVFIYRKTDYLLAHQLRTDREHDGVLQDAYAKCEEDTREDLDMALGKAYELADYQETPLVMVPYEGFVSNWKVREGFFRSLELEPPDLDWFNANEHPRYSKVKALPW